MILVTGATGFIGKALVDRLIAANYPVRVLVPPRRMKHALPWPDDNVSVAQAALTDSQALHQAMNGVHTVIHLASAQWWGRRRDLEQIDLLGTQNIITAGRSARIGRLMILSHLGASPSSAFTLLKTKGQVEEAVKASGLPYTIFRSGAIFGPEDTFVNGIAMLLRANPLVFLQPGFGEGLLHPLYVGDLVEALTLSLEHLDTVDQVISIGGPEYISFNEMVRTIMRVTRTRRAFLTLPPYIMRTVTGVMQRLFPYWPMTLQWLDMLASNRTAPMGRLFELFAMKPVRFEDTILTYMPQRRYRAELLRSLIRRRPREA